MISGRTWAGPTHYGTRGVRAVPSSSAVVQMPVHCCPVAVLDFLHLFQHSQGLGLPTTVSVPSPGGGFPVCAGNAVSLQGRPAADVRQQPGAAERSANAEGGEEEGGGQQAWQV